MKSGLHMLGASALLVSSMVAGVALAQPPAAGAAPATPPVSMAPTYAVIDMEVAVNKPAAEVWARVGKYCDIGEWLLRNPASCTLRVGTGEVGTVRSVGEEVLVGKTPLSYTYTQTPAFQARGQGATRPYNLYHGTLEARPVTATTSKLVYTLVYDNSMLADQAAKDRDMQSRRTTFTNALNNMKILAEGGQLPPAPARGGGAPPAPAGGARGN